MVTHGLRMCQYVDKVIQMLDGKVERIIEDKREIHALAKSRQVENVEMPPAIEIPVAQVSTNGRHLVPFPAF